MFTVDASAGGHMSSTLAAGQMTCHITRGCGRAVPWRRKSVPPPTPPQLTGLLRTHEAKAIHEGTFHRQAQDRLQIKNSFSDCIDLAPGKNVH